MNDYARNGGFPDDHFNKKSQRQPKEEDKRPAGEKIRDILEGPLNDPDKKAIQLDILNEAFYDMAEILPRAVEMNFSKLEKEAAGIEDEDGKNEALIEFITKMERTMGGYAPKFSADMPMQVPVSTQFTDFSWNDVRELPGYIKLHETARDCDVAISPKYLVEKGPEGLNIPPSMTIHTTMSYHDGALKYSQSYPHLPEKKEEPKNKPSKPGSGDFTF